jgi:NADPH:quinone reductase-like Zn-dependent oxidoreductase
MKAVRIHKHGDINTLRIDTIGKPKITDEQILINIKAASLNHLDLWVREGIPGVPLPLIMGSDGCGIITKIGNKVKSPYNLKINDRVFIAPIRSCGKCDYCRTNRDNLCEHFQIPGESVQGTMAEYIAVEGRYVFPLPAEFSCAEGAAFPLSALTAYHMLLRKTDIAAAEWALIYGASSGVGSAAIQIAKYYHTKVITTIGDEKKREQARKSGADYIINYKTESVGKTVKKITNNMGADLVFEHPGASTWKESLRALKIGGTIITCGATSGHLVKIDLRALFIKHQRIIGSTMGALSDIHKILDLIEKRAYRPVIDREFLYTEIKSAHRYLEEGNHFGKIIIRF